MKHYKIEEFLTNTTPTSLADEVEKKISLLYDFCILVHKKATAHDAREEMVRQILQKCQSAISIDGVVHDLLVGKITLNELLRRYNYVY